MKGFKSFLQAKAAEYKEFFDLLNPREEEFNKVFNTRRTEFTNGYRYTINNVPTQKAMEGLARLDRIFIRDILWAEKQWFVVRNSKVDLSFRVHMTDDYHNFTYVAVFKGVNNIDASSYALVLLTYDDDGTYQRKVEGPNYTNVLDKTGRWK